VSRLATVSLQASFLLQVVQTLGHRATIIRSLATACLANFPLESFGAVFREAHLFEPILDHCMNHLRALPVPSNTDELTVGLYTHLCSSALRILCSLARIAKYIPLLLCKNFPKHVTPLIVNDHIPLVIQLGAVMLLNQMSDFPRGRSAVIAAIERTSSVRTRLVLLAYASMFAATNASTQAHRAVMYNYAAEIKGLMHVLGLVEPSGYVPFWPVMEPGT
jgi:hypothetical protein